MNFELSDEQRMWHEAVHTFVSQEVKQKGREVDEKAAFNWEATHKMGPMGMLGLYVPEEYGGSGSDFLSCVLVMEELNKGDAGLATSWGAHTVLCTESIYRNGNEEQRRKFLPGLVEGSKIGALAITEPEAGSDALSMRTRALETL